MKVFVGMRGPAATRRRTRAEAGISDDAGKRQWRSAEMEGAVSGFRPGIAAAIPALRRYARALTRDAELADDLVQDTLVRALRSEHLFHGGDIRSWLYTILTNLNRNRLRTLARRPVLAPIKDSDATTSGPDSGGRDIVRALEMLTEEQRSALLLIVLESLTYRDRDVAAGPRPQ